MELKLCPFCGGETGESAALCGENYDGKWWCYKGDYNTRTSAECGRLREALKFIDKWELPRTKYDDKTSSSFEVAHGSNGARDFIRKIAREALRE